MDKLLFVDSAYRKKTRSCDFLIDLLKRHFDVELFFIEEEQIDSIRRKGREEFAAVVFCQISPAYYINYFNGQNIIFMPMYDTFSVSKRTHLLFLRRVKWLCFTRKYEPFLDGVDKLFIKYYPEPRIPTVSGNPGSFFLWQRHDAIHWETAKKLIGDANVDEVNIHAACDPGVTFMEPSGEDRRKYNISVTSWFETKSDYDRNLTRFGYFFSPRGKEGIGLSFLDAMSLGLVVIAPNDATMNEYIADGLNGYLYDIDDPKPISFGDFKSVRERSIRDVIEGRKAWLGMEEEIISFIRRKPKRIAYPVNKGALVNAMDFFRRGSRHG